MNFGKYDLYIRFRYNVKLNFNFRCQNFYTIQLSLLGGKVSEWKVQKLTLHIQMFNKFNNFFLLWHFYYTSILDCFIYFYFFLQSHLSNQWMAASSRFLGFRRRSQFALWLGSCSRSRGKNLLCQVSAFFHIIIR